MDQQQQHHPSQHLYELQNEILKREVETLKQENAVLSRENAELRQMYSELRGTYNALKQSLDEAVRTSRQRTTEQAVEPADSERAEDTVDNDGANEPQHSHECLAEDRCES